MRCIFQLAGFEVFPETPSEPMEPLFEFQIFGSSNRLDLGPDGMSQIVFEQQAAAPRRELGYSHHFAHSLASAPNIRGTVFRESELASFRDGPDVSDTLRSDGVPECR